MLLGPILLPWYVVWALPLVWLLPRVPRLVLLGTSVALGVSQWTAEPARFPGAYDTNVLIGHYVITPRRDRATRLAAPRRMAPMARGPSPAG